MLSRSTTYYLLLTTHYSLLTTYYWLLTTDYWLLTTDYWLLTTDYWLLTIDYWLLLLTTHYLLLTTYYLLLTTTASGTMQSGALPFHIVLTTTYYLLSSSTYYPIIKVLWSRELSYSTPLWRYNQTDTTRDTSASPSTAWRPPQLSACSIWHITCWACLYSAGRSGREGSPPRHATAHPPLPLLQVETVSLPSKAALPAVAAEILCLCWWSPSFSSSYWSSSSGLWCMQSSTTRTIVTTEPEWRGWDSNK